MIEETFTSFPPTAEASDAKSDVVVITVSVAEEKELNPKVSKVTDKDSLMFLIFVCRMRSHRNLELNVDRASSSRKVTRYGLIFNSPMLKLRRF